jgi:hypothetical protein
MTSDPDWTLEVDSYLDNLQEMEPPESEEEESEEETYLGPNTNASKATGDGQKSSDDVNNIITEPYPGDAGSPIKQGVPRFEAMRQLHGLNPAIPPSLLDPATWQLARWLMTSGLSGAAREEFFKLDWVRTLSLRSIDHRLTHIYMSQHSDTIPWKSNYEFLKAIDSLPHGPGWCRVEHMQEGDLGSESVDIWMRDPVDCVRELIGNPSFAEEMRYAPVKEFKRTRAGLAQVYSEMWSASWWWQTQVCTFESSLLKRLDSLTSSPC